MDQIPYFPASFLLFRIDLHVQSAITVSTRPTWSLNNARIQIEACCQIFDRLDQKRSTYVLGASCKTEKVGVEREMWHMPYADFCPILSDEEFLILKSWERNDKGVMLYPPTLGVQPERQSGMVADAYAATRIELPPAHAEELKDAEAIVQATLAGALLAGRVAFTAQERYEVTIDFPIKTMNANERENIFQPDTGPLLFPDFTAPRARMVESFRLAFVAFNRPDWAEFLLQVPTPLTSQISVNHYSQVVALETRNSVYRILGPA